MTCLLNEEIEGCIEDFNTKIKAHQSYINYFNSDFLKMKDDLLKETITDEEAKSFATKHSLKEIYMNELKEANFSDLKNEKEMSKEENKEKLDSEITISSEKSDRHKNHFLDGPDSHLAKDNDHYKTNYVRSILFRDRKMNHRNKQNQLKQVHNNYIINYFRFMIFQCLNENLYFYFRFHIFY